MKTHATIDWFEKPTPQATACISFNCKGLISFNSAARQLLPDYVDLGYDRHTRILYLREGKKRKGLSVRNTSGTLKPLTISMANSGVTFPVRYEIQTETAGDSIWQAVARYYDAKTLLKKIRSIRDPKAARSSEEMQHLLLLYEETLRKICRSFSRSIPKADRFQLAQEGFLDGVLSYQHYLADFDEHIRKTVVRFLKSQIPNYSAGYKECYSLPQTGTDGSEYEIYHSAKAEESFRDMLDKYDLSHTLTPLELQVHQLLKQGYIRSEICHMLHINVCVYNKTYSAIKKALRGLDDPQ